MAQQVCIQLINDDRERLQRIVGDRNTAQKHAWRARIILASAEGLNVQDIARQVGISRPAVWRWQQRFAEEGVNGLLRDKSRPPGTPPLAAEVVRRVVELTMSEPPGAATRWTGRRMARYVGISLKSVQRIWADHKLKPQRIRTFKLSRDPDLAGKLRDVVGLYVDPPQHAVVLSVDEKGQIQALDRTQPGLPLKPGKAGTMTHDYKRHGTTTLFAALNVLDGTVIGRCKHRQRQQEFISFLNTLDQKVPAGKVVHVVLDNLPTHDTQAVRDWLDRHPRFVFHFTPKSCSWLNAVETFFSKLTRHSLQRGAFKSVKDLEGAIYHYIQEHNDDPKPFVWTADPDRILDSMSRVNLPSESLH